MKVSANNFMGSTFKSVWDDPVFSDAPLSSLIPDDSVRFYRRGLDPALDEHMGGARGIGQIDSSDIVPVQRRDPVVSSLGKPRLCFRDYNSLGAHGKLTTSARIELTTQESDHATRRRHQARG